MYEESWGYAEGAIPEQVTIAGNTFIRSGGIELGLVPRDTALGIFDRKIIRNIDIRDNLLVEGNYIHVMYADGVRVVGNVFVDPCRAYRQNGDFSESRGMFGHPHYLGMERHGAVFVTSSCHVEVRNNLVYLSGKGNLKAVELGRFAEKKTIHCHGNRAIRQNGSSLAGL